MTASNQNVEHEFPRAIGRPATNALLVQGITTFRQLTKISEKEILKLVVSQFGWATLIIRKATYFTNRVTHPN